MGEIYSGQVVLVAGGTGGLGRAVSIAFLEEGATLAVTYRRQSEFESLRDVAGAHASRLDGYSLDVTNDAAIQQMISSVATKHGRLDALTNALGGYAAGKNYGRQNQRFSTRCFPSTSTPAISSCDPWCP